MSEVLSALAELPIIGTAAALCTIIRTKGSTPRKEGCKMLVYTSGSIVGTIGGGEVEGRVIKEALDSIQTGERKIRTYDLINPEKGDPGICGGTLEVFIDPLTQPEDLIVVGGGHVGKAVVYLAKWLGFRVILSDDREEFCSSAYVPGADEYVHCSLEDLSSKIEFSPETVIIMATRNNHVDVRGLPELLAAPSAYIGVISSRRRWKLTVEQLLETGIKKKDLDRIHAPIGLDLKAETPEEIALSIMAEVLQVIRGGSGKGLS
ncbi:MAG: XdhC family protein [Anaerolineales bacterium]|nr:XdhC family protein [Anaerolineales bacterium]